MTYFVGNSALQHTAQYDYTSSRLTGLEALNFTTVGSTNLTAIESFGYDLSGRLASVQFPDYSTATTLPDYNAGSGVSNADARASLAYQTSGTRSATVTCYGCLPTASAPHGATGQAVTQVYTCLLYTSPSPRDS